MFIASIDPGKVTGVAILFDATEERRFHSFEEPAMDAMETLEDYLRGKEDSHLVWEKFTISSFTHKHSTQNDALEVIGVLKFLGRGYKLIVHTPQAPANRKVVSDDALKRLGWWNYSKDKHQIDAAKHLALLAMKLGVLEAKDIR